MFLPLFQQLQNAQRILIAGAGGGFDCYCGIPLMLHLQAQGKEIVMANLSFTELEFTTSAEVFPTCYEVKASDYSPVGNTYFPEKYLKQWMELSGIEMPVYAFLQTGPKPLRKAYQFLLKKHGIDAVILVDGGTDSLMFGDEEGLGTPFCDMSSIAAVHGTQIDKQFLVCLGFGVDHFHGVSHYRFLENVAKVSKSGGFLGAFSLLAEMEEAQAYQEAVAFANEFNKGRESIVSNSIVSAMEGFYGDYHRTSRTAGSELWINPLMSMYWCFDLHKVVPHIAYLDDIRETNSISEFFLRLRAYRNKVKNFREKRQLPS